MSGVGENTPQQETLYRIIAEHVPGGVALYDGQTNIVLWHNRAYTELLDEKWHGMDLTGRHLDELAPGVASEAREAGRAAASGETVRLRGLRRLGPSGDAVYHNVTFVPVPREDGKGFDVLITLLDVTGEVLAAQEVERQAREPRQQVAADELKARNEALIQSEERYRSVSELIPHGIWASDASGGITYVSPAMLELTGLSSEEYRDFQWSELMPEAEREPFVKAWLLAVERREYWSHEYRMLGKDGQYHWLIGRGIPQFDADGVFTGYLGVNVDIDDLKQAQERLALQAAELNVIVDSIADGVSISDATGRLVRFNEAARQMMRYDGYEHATMEERKQRCTYRRPDGTEYALEDLPLSRSLHGEIVKGELIEMVWPEGGSTWVTSSTAPTYDAQGNLTGVVLTNTDVTALRQAQEALEKTYGRLRALFDPHIGGMGIVISNAAGDVIEANDFYLNLIGYSRQDLEAGEISWRDITPPEWLPVDEAGLAELAEHGMAGPIEKEYVRRDGRRVPVLMVFYTVPGATDEIVVFALDISRMKQAERERERLLEQVQAERERLFSVLSLFPAYVALLTPEHECAFVNQRFIEWFGEPQPGQKCYNLLFGRGEPCENCRCFECLSDGNPRVSEWISPQNRFFEVYYYPFTVPDGPPMVLEVGFDITARKQAAQELEQHRERLEELVRARTAEVQERSRVLESVFNNNLSSLVLLDTDFNFIRVNEAYARSCGRTIEDFPGHNHFVDYPGEELRAAFVQVVQTGNPWQAYARPFEFPDHPEWGTTYWDLSVVPIRDAEEEAKMLLFSLQDATEETKARQMLEERTAEVVESERKYRELVEDANSAIIRWTRDGDLVYANEFAERLFGYEPGELVGQDVSVLLPRVQSDGRSLETLLDDITVHPEKYATNENENVTKDGRRLWLSWTNRVAYDAQGNVESVLGVAVDRTVQHQAELQLLAYQQQLRQLAAELALAEQRERQRIATGLHDDISQTLAYAKMKLKQVTRAADEAEREAGGEELGEILDTAIQETRNLIYQLSTPVLFQKGLAEAVRWVAARAHEQYNQRVTVDVVGEVRRLDEDIEVTVFQAVKELLNNAQKYAPGADVTIRIDYRDNGLRIEVADTGAGFDASPCALESTGRFGLLNMRERLAYMGGSLNIDSAYGQGSRCTVQLPAEALSRT